MSAAAPTPPTVLQQLASVNERAWTTLGKLAEMMADWERALNAYENALRHNPRSLQVLHRIASLYRGREQFSKAIEYFTHILEIQENDGEAWSAMGHCHLMMENLKEAYHAYQQALYHLPNPKDPRLWYGIGILYDRYGSIEHAEEAFTAVMKMDPNFEKANEIYFRLGIIYKQQQKFDLSLQCFRYILHNPPRPLTEMDIWFQTGHVYEQEKQYEYAKEAYERVLEENPDHAKVLQQLGWLYHQQNTPFTSQTQAIALLTRSLKADGNDAQSWYLLGRCYMAEQKYSKAYEAYQQAVYRDARNPTFWCSIGVLYYQINQYRDALDAYSRAIRLNPYISEVWYDLGTLYESCNNQIQDAMDAYQRASELDPSNPHIRQRIELLRKAHKLPPSTPAATPVPQDVNNPYQYTHEGAPPSNHTYPPPLGYNGQRPGSSGGNLEPPNHHLSVPPSRALHDVGNLDKQPTAMQSPSPSAPSALSASSAPSAPSMAQPLPHPHLPQLASMSPRQIPQGRDGQSPMASIRQQEVHPSRPSSPITQQSPPQHARRSLHPPNSRGSNGSVSHIPQDARSPAPLGPPPSLTPLQSSRSGSISQGPVATNDSPQSNDSLQKSFHRQTTPPYRRMSAGSSDNERRLPPIATRARPPSPISDKDRPKRLFEMADEDQEASSPRGEKHPRLRSSPFDSHREPAV